MLKFFPKTTNSPKKQKGGFFVSNLDEALLATEERAIILSNCLPYEEDEKFDRFLLLNKENKTPLETLIFSRNQINLPQAKKIADMLSKNTTVQVLEFNENEIDGSACLELLKGLEENSSLVCLNFYSTPISDVAVQYVSRLMFLNNSITELRFSENDFSPNGIIQLFMLSRSPSLKTLSISYNPIEPSGWKNVTKFIERSQNYLINLSLVSMGIDDKTIKLVIEAALSNKKIRFLDLKSNFISNDGIKEMLGVFSRTCTLEEIDLSHNKIGISGFLDFVEFLRKNELIKKIKFDSNPIDQKYVDVLFDILKEKSKITVDYEAETGYTWKIDDLLCHVLALEANDRNKILSDLLDKIRLSMDDKKLVLSR